MSMKKAGVADSGAIRLIVYCSKSLFQKQNKTKRKGKAASLGNLRMKKKKRRLK